mgnify:CR=1 FL=1
MHRTTRLANDATMKLLPAALLSAALLFHLSVNAQPGTVDPTFDPGAGPNNRVLVTAVQADGKVLIAGDFTQVAGTPRNRIARLNADGSLDATFDPGSGPQFAVFAIAVQADGRILVGGHFNTFNGTSSGMIARLNADGSLDSGFTPGSGADWLVLSIAVQPDGRILVGGNFDSFNGLPRSGITRLNADGSQDLSFNPGTGLATTGAAKTVNAFALQPDGRIVIAGQFSSYNGTARSCIARLNADGSLDASFNPGTGATNGDIDDMVRQPDGKLVIAGNFTNYNGTSTPRFARVNPDGSLDTGFSTGTGPDSFVLALALQADGRILLGGFFDSYNDVVVRDVARVNPDGTLDETYGSIPGAFGLDNGIYDIALQADGKLIIGGLYSQFDETLRNNIARLESGGFLDVSEGPNPARQLLAWPNPTTSLLMLPVAASGTIVDARGREVQAFTRSTALDVAVLAPGSYILRTDDGQSVPFLRE